MNQPVHIGRLDLFISQCMDRSIALIIRQKKQHIRPLSVPHKIISYSLQISIFSRIFSWLCLANLQTLWYNKIRKFHQKVSSVFIRHSKTVEGG